MSCPTVTTIQATECIGNSLNTINANFNNLKISVCDNESQIISLASQVNIANIGAISYFPVAATNIPSGWKLCDGQLLVKNDYLLLWAFAEQSGNLVEDSLSATQVGSFCTLDDTTVFRIPDLRGYFLRGAGTNDNGTASGELGKKQEDNFKKHAHAFYYSEANTIGGTGSNQTLSDDIGGGPGSGKITVTTTEVGGTETRPVNVALQPCIYAGV